METYFNNRFYGVLSAGIDHYDYQVANNDNPVNAYRLEIQHQSI